MPSLHKMLPMKPVRFYGASLPRPRIYNDVKYNTERVDPPTPVNHSLLRWANDAHWSMGGLSNKRPRMQGKIEGRLKNLRNEKEEGETSSDDDESVSKRAMKKKRLSPVKNSKNVISSEARPKRFAQSGKENSTSTNRGSSRSKQSPAPTVKRSSAPAGKPPLPTLRVVVTPHPSVSPTKQPISSPSPSSYLNASQSPEFPVMRRRQVDRALPSAEDSDSDVNLEEFARVKNQPLRKSSRVTAIRRSFRDLVASDSEQDTIA